MGLTSLSISAFGMDSYPYTTPTKNGQSQQNMLKTPDDNAFLDTSLLSSVDTNTSKQVTKDPQLTQTLKTPLEQLTNLAPDKASPPSHHSSLSSPITQNGTTWFNSDDEAENDNKAPQNKDVEIITALEKHQNNDANDSINNNPQNSALGVTVTAILNQKIPQQTEKSPLLPNGNYSIKGHRSDSSKNSLTDVSLDEDSKKCCILL